MKRYRVEKDMLLIYINEFCNKQLFCLINLFIVNKHSQKVFQHLILTFYLTVYLNMKCDIQTSLNARIKA